MREEKDFFVRVLEDFETQKSEYGNLLGPARLHGQMRDFTEWHRDIMQRENYLQARFDLNALVAHTQLAKRNITARDKNQIALINTEP